MMGSVLFNVNVRLSEDHHLHHEPRPAQGAAGECRIPAGVQRHPRPAGIGGTRHPAQRRRAAGRRRAGHGRRIRALLAASPARFDFPDFDEHTRATTFYTTGTTGLPKGVFFSHRQLALHTLSAALGLANNPEHGRLHREDVGDADYADVPCAWGVPYIATPAGHQAGLPRPPARAC